MHAFEEIAPECEATVNVTSFRFGDKTYTISTTEIMSLAAIQRRFDLHAGYTGKLGNYETMLFIDQESMVYPFGDLPGNDYLGVFQRYDTEDEARDGHQEFVTRVQRFLCLLYHPFTHTAGVELYYAFQSSSTAYAFSRQPKGGYLRTDLLIITQQYVCPSSLPLPLLLTCINGLVAAIL